jgi:hypothetical protein
MIVDPAHRKNRKVGSCGQAPSDYPDFAEFLAEIGIDSISLNPDSLAAVTRRLALETDSAPADAAEGSPTILRIRPRSGPVNPGPGTIILAELTSMGVLTSDD